MVRRERERRGEEMEGYIDRYAFFSLCFFLFFCCLSVSLLSFFLSVCLLSVCCQSVSLSVWWTGGDGSNGSNESKMDGWKEDERRRDKKKDIYLLSGEMEVLRRDGGINRNEEKDEAAEVRLNRRASAAAAVMHHLV